MSRGRGRPDPAVLLVKTGTTDPEVVAACGDYDDWFRAALPARCETVRPFLGETLPPFDAFDGVLITGSKASVRDEAPWMGELAAWGLEAARRLPVLAVCFGHQLLGEALGGRVERNPAGPEYGTIQVRLSPAGRSDPLFRGLPRLVELQATHADALVRPPEGASLLAGNSCTPWQAFAWGPHLRAVQFHPELPLEALRLVLRVRGLRGEARPAPAGPRLLRNWAALL